MVILAGGGGVGGRGGGVLVYVWSIFARVRWLVVSSAFKR
jgi:hypothetical protein